MHSQPVATDQTLERVVRAIAERAQPRRIVFFGSRARGDARPESDYDLMVELEFDDMHHCRRELLRAVRVAGVSVDIFLRKPGELEAKWDDPGRMDWDIGREGVVVYPPGAVPLAAPAAATGRTPSIIRDGAVPRARATWPCSSPPPATRAMPSRASSRSAKS